MKPINAIIEPLAASVTMAIKYRFRCACGKRGAWQNNMATAQADGDRHLQQVGNDPSHNVTIEVQQ